MKIKTASDYSPTAYLQIYTTQVGNRQRASVTFAARLDEADGEEKVIRHLVNRLLEEHPEYDPHRSLNGIHQRD